MMGTASIPNDPLNITAFTVDRQLALGRAGSAALRWIDRRRNRHDLTYGQLADGASRTARVLLDAGIVHGDVVAVLLPKTPELFLIALAAWKIGAIFCPLLASADSGPIERRLELGQAKILITTPSLYTHHVAPHRYELPDLKSILIVSEPDVLPPKGSLDFAALLAAADPSSVVTADTYADTPAFLHFTSGTSGFSKGTLHGHGVARVHQQSAQHLFQLTAQDVYWCTAEPGWVPFTAYGIIAPLAVGCLTVMDSQEFSAQRWYSILVEDQVTVWYTTPYAISMMMRQGEALARSYRKFALRIAASGGAPLHADAATWGKRAFGTTFINSWWQSETGAILVANDPDTAKPGSMGHPLPGVEIAVVERTPQGVAPIRGHAKVGELAVRSNLPSMFIGYIHDDHRYQQAFSNGWYLTGDHVRRDHDDFLWFAGRGDDLIRFQGDLIGPFELENTLLDHPAVAEAAVVGRGDGQSGQIPVAFIALNSGFEAGPSLERELLEFARNNLEIAAPREIYFIDTLPRTPTGCIMRRSLRDRLTRTQREALISSSA